MPTVRLIITSFLLLMFATSFAQRNEDQGWEVKNYTETKARSYLDANKYYLDKVEGIWQSTDGFKYAIEKDVENGSRVKNRFRMVILESSVNGWRPTQVKAFIDYGSVNSIYSMKYYIRNTATGANLSSENLLLLFESDITMSFQRLNGTKIGLIKLYPAVASDIPASQGSQFSHASQAPAWTGTCFAIAKDLVVTNYHVVEDAASLALCGAETFSKEEYSAEVILTDKYNDLAVLRITDYRFKGFNIKYGFNYNVADIGTDVFVLGYPLISTMGTDIKLTTGVVSSKTGFTGDVSLYQISAPVQPGSSGGPLFNSAGNIIGIVNAKHNGAENVGYAIKASYLKNLLDSSLEPITISNSNVIAPLSLSEKVKAITPCVLMVKAFSSSYSQQQTQQREQHVGNETNMRKAQALLESAQEKFDKKEYNDSYTDVCQSVDLYPTPVSQYLKGFLARYYIYDVDAAIEALSYCLNNDYREDACIDMLADCFMVKEDFERAVYYLDKAVAKDRKDVSALERRGFCKAKLGLTDDAIADYRQAIKFDGIVDYNFYMIYNNLAFHLMKKGNYTEADAYINESIKANGLYGNAWDTYGELNYHKGNYEECIRCMDISITNGLTVKDASWLGNSYFYRGLAKKAIGNLAGAYKDLERADGLEQDGASEELTKIDVVALNLDEDGSFSEITKSPRVGKHGDTDLEIKGVEISNEFTALHLYWLNTKYENGYYYISRDAYIRDKSTGKKYQLIATENCAVDPLRTNLDKGESASFTLYFKAIPSDTKEIDFIESADSNWKFYGIKLR